MSSFFRVLQVAVWAATLVAPIAIQALPGEQGMMEVEPSAEDTRALEAKQFRQKYTAQGQPKLTIYFNRELNEDVREWASNSRLAVAFQGIATGFSQVEAADGYVTTEQQNRLAKHAKRVPPFSREGWMWRLENGVKRHMRKGGARLVDLRLPERKAAANKKNQDQFGNVSQKEIETAALAKNADMLVELLFDNPPSGSSLSVSVEATSTQSGEIVASFVNTYELDEDGQLVFVDDNGEEIELSKRKKKYVATNTGYAEKESRAEVNINDVAKHIAQSLQGELVSLW